MQRIKAALGVLALAAGLGAAVPVQATPVGLALLIDSSGSIGITNYNLQKNGYIAALNAILPADGSVAIEVIQFSSTVQTVFALQTISNAADKAALIAAITAMTYLNANTATGPAIQQAVADMQAFFGAALNGKQLIDVSTDGFGNVGISENTAAANAVAAGVEQVNVLCIGGAANCAFNAGAGSFNIAATFANFQATLEEKLRRELNIPEPGNLALLGIAMVAMVLARRRKAA